MIQHQYRLTLFGSGLCGRAVKNSNSGSGGPVFKPRPLRCFLRQARTFTTLITLFTQAQAQMVTGDMLLQGIPAMDQRTIHGSSNTPRSAKETGISSVRLGLWLVYAFFHQDKWQCFPESFDFSTNEITHRKTNKQTTLFLGSSDRLLDNP